MRTYNISSTIHKILGLQALFQSSFNLTSFRQISSITATDPDINRTLSYWFEGENPQKKWFQGGPQVDAEIKDQFGDLIEKARASKLNSWSEEPKGTLALLLLMDQFPRNVFRGSPLSFSSDSMAFDIATKAIAKGQHHEVTPIQEAFFYMPLMHDEKLVSQIAAVALYEALVARCASESDEAKFAIASLDFCKRHLENILQFGRFPARNAILDRESTTEEIELLKENPSGF